MPKAAHGEWSCKTGEKVTDPVKNHDAAYGQFGEDYVDNSRRHYYASVTFVDEQIGRIVEALKEKNMYDNTLILFTSDHGDMLGDHNICLLYTSASAIVWRVASPHALLCLRIANVGSVNSEMRHTAASMSRRLL